MRTNEVLDWWWPWVFQRQSGGVIPAQEKPGEDDRACGPDVKRLPWLGCQSLCSGPEPPNILFIIFDDWNVNHAGAYGCDWIKTPGFDRVASEGILFRNVFTSNPKCSPCRATILTGRNSWQLEEAVCHFGIFPSKFAVYPDLLEESGYFVGLTGKGWGPGDFRAGGRHPKPGRPFVR